MDALTNQGAKLSHTQCTCIRKMDCDYRIYRMCSQFLFLLDFSKILCSSKIQQKQRVLFHSIVFASFVLSQPNFLPFCWCSFVHQLGFNSNNSCSITGFSTFRLISSKITLIQLRVWKKGVLAKQYVPLGIDY